MPSDAAAEKTPDYVSQARRLLREVFGYDSFIPPQAEVIDAIIGGRDALVLMPTGGGKSLCYQIPALARTGVAVVVSPLLSLMKNQVDALQQNGVNAVRLDSTLSTAQYQQAQKTLTSGAATIVYVSPERALTDSFAQLLATINLSLFAIDEAHCVSQWGHDFRPEYTRLSELCEQFPNAPRAAFTATADDSIRDEIIQKLKLRRPQVFVSSFNRPNIRYLVREKSGAHKELAGFIGEHHSNECGIVYCRTRAGAEEAAEKLTAAGYRAVAYHAGLNAATRTRHQEQFQNEDDLIVAATVAFGMGIDKPNVRFVAHLNLPKSIEYYYQETGRAGRDGEPANALLFYGLSDLFNNRRMIEQSDSPPDIKRREYDKLNILLNFAESSVCRRRALLAYFGEQFNGDCGNCDNCLTPPQTIDGTVAVQKFLSCAIRSGELFGAAHLIDVLLGKETDKVKKFNHQHLSTFNIGGDYIRAEWNRFARQAAAAGFLSPDENGSLKISETGRRFLKNRETITLRKPPQKPAVVRKKASQLKQSIDEEMNIPPFNMYDATLRAGKSVRTRRTERYKTKPSPSSAKLFEALRLKRLAIAKEKGVPPFVIFHDTTLQEMAATKPSTKTEMSTIAGVGEYKLQQYGDAFLQAVRQHADE